MVFDVESASDYCSRVTDGTHDSPKPKENGRYLITSKHLGQYELDFSRANKISEQDYQKIIQRSSVAQWDVLISMIGTIGNIYLETSEFVEYACKNVGIFKMGGNEGKAKWLYYYLQSPKAKEYIFAASRGSIQGYIPLNALRNMPVDVIDDKTRDKMVSILWNLDMKIRENQKINDNLEQMAKTIYDYWFIQFDFPDESGKPYRSSGGKMVWNEQLKREIPTDWEVKSLSQIMKKNSKPFDYSSEQVAVDLSVMPSNSIAITQLNSSKNFATNLFEMKRGDILFGSIRPYLHKAGVAPCNGVVAGTVHSYRVLRNFDYNFALMTIARPAFFDYAVNVSSGTKMPVVSSEAILSYKVPYSESIAKLFSKIPIMETITHNAMESLNLDAIRDWLLPMLMNGQATVSD